MSSLLDEVLRVNIYCQSIIFVLGVVTNLVSIGILTSRALRSSPCSHYFLAYAVLSILCISITCPTHVLRGFGIDWANERIGCKLHFYFLFLFPFQTNLMLLFASFDRYYSSRKSRHMTTAHSVHTARIVIIIGLASVAVYMSPMLIIYSFNETTKLCYLQSTLFVYGYAASQIIVFYVVLPFLMIIFGILTIINIHQQARRVGQPSLSMIGRRTEGQLARMLLLQIGVHLILTIPFGVVYMMNSLDASTRTARIIAIRYILVSLQEIDYFVSFFLYVLSAGIYRQEFLRVLRILPRCLSRGRVHRDGFPQTCSLSAMVRSQVNHRHE